MFVQRYRSNDGVTFEVTLCRRYQYVRLGFWTWRWLVEWR